MDCPSSPKETARDAPAKALNNGAIPTRGRARKIAGKVLRFVIVPALIVLVIYSPRYDEGLLLSLDEGHYLAPVNALLEGKTLYRDIYTFYGPILNYALALSMKLFGVTISTYRATFIWGAVFVLLLTYLLLTSMVKRNVFAFLGGWMIAFISDGASFWYSRYAGFRLFGPLLSAFCFIGYFRDKNRKWLLCAAGALGAVSFFTSPEMTYPALATCAVALVVSATTSHHLDRARLLQAAKLYAVGFFATLLPFAIWLAIRRALVPYLQIGFYDVPFLLGKAYPISDVFERPPMSLSLYAWRRFSLTRACLVYVMLAVYACALCYLVAKWKRKGEFDFRDSCMAVTLGIGVPLLHTASGRLAGFQLFFGVPPALVVLAFLWERLYEWIRMAVEHIRARPGAGFSRRILVLLMALAVFSCSLLWMGHRTIRKANARSFLRSYGLRPLPAELRCVPLDLERAGIAVPEDQARQVKNTVDYVLAHTAPGEPILALPHEGTLYFLADRPSPIRFSTMVYTELRPEYATEAIEDLEKVRPRLAVYVADSYIDPYFDITAEERLAPLVGYLKTHYTEVDAIGASHFYIRNEQSNQP